MPKQGKHRPKTTSRPAHTPKQAVGWAEHVSLPQLGVPRLRAKVDTGAKTSALHVENVRRLKGDRVSFDVLLDRDQSRKRVRATAPLKRNAVVRPSDGLLQQRMVVETTVRIGNVERVIEVSLVGRDDMTFRMLLGRSAVRGDFLVDPSRRYLMDAEAHASGRARKSTRKKRVR